MSATRKTTWSRPMTTGADWAAEAARVARVASSGMRGSFGDLGPLLRRCGAPLGALGAGGATFLGGQDAVVVGVQAIEPRGGGALRALHRVLDILVFRDVA